MHGDDVHISFGQDQKAVLGVFGQVHGEEVHGLFVNHCVGRIDVLGLGVVQHPSSETDDIAPQIDNGEDDPVSEFIVMAAAAAWDEQIGHLGLFWRISF